ncbi:iron chelate uptake ABC transporter family permease subunit [Kurthia huakuii]|uniref:iron chelate uptake ABC transporter family permease subunit n=1 Tax=Kurthia huakuii TaxID=1421019 RepID=UPI000497C9DA|nr:iron chelate uptake ABC transporter family permease subunit [Kurthia huakuii]MBM7699916.1 iron complex transport system permease protein [Kurthia huakuii]
MQNSIKKTNTIKILCLVALAILSIAGFLFYNIQGNFSYAFPKRVYRVAAMIITAIAIAYATVMFQTVTRNRILTPSMIGVDSMYEVVQTVIYFFLGSASVFVVDRYLNFGTSIVAMVLFALLLYRFLFRADKYPIFLLLLAGMIIGTLLGSLVSFLQVMIDPVEYLSLQNKLFASFTNVKSELVGISAVILIACFIYGAFLMRDLDVMNLGRDNAINLGVNYDKLVLRVLILASILIATSTALVGPITFLGLIVSNLAYQFLVTYRHSILILGASLISIIALVGGQFLVLHVFNLNTTISVIINFVGGIYFIYLLLKQSKGVAG